MAAQESRRLIIFVGHDNSGKSSIIKELKGKIGFDSLKVDLDTNKYSRNIMKDDLALQRMVSYDVQLQFLEKIKSLKVIFDRGHPCEYAYANTFNREYDEKALFDFDKRCKKLNALIVYCYKDKEYFEDDTEDHIKSENYEQLKKYYEIFLNRSECDVLRLNTSNEDIKYQLNTIMEVL